jgi:ankyrin repeat protein
MGTQLGGLSDDLLLCVFDATLTARPRGHVALERLSATCRAFRELRIDPVTALRLCEAHGVPARTRERFYPGPRSMCTPKGFYRRVVSHEYALRIDAEFECSVVAGDVARMGRLLALGASVHLPDYAQLKQESRRRRQTPRPPLAALEAEPPRSARRLRKRECHANGYDSEEADVATPLLKRAAVCGHAAACALLLRAAGGLPPERLPLLSGLQHVADWGSSCVLTSSQEQSVCTRNEVNDAACAAYECDNFGVLRTLLDEGAVVEPSASHDEAVRYASTLGNHAAAEGLRALFRVAKPTAYTMSTLLDHAVMRGQIGAARELLAQGARPVPGEFWVSWLCAYGQLEMLQMLLPVLREVQRAKGWAGLDRDLADGLHSACYYLASPGHGRAWEEGGPHATSYMYLAVANWLLDDGVTPANYGNNEGATLVLACQSGNAALVRRLIDAGESPDASDGLPMTLALAENHLEVVKVLNDAMVPILNKRLRSRHE